MFILTEFGVAKDEAEIYPGFDVLQWDHLAQNHVLSGNVNLVEVFVLGQKRQKVARLPLGLNIRTFTLIRRHQRLESIFESTQMVPGELIPQPLYRIREICHELGKMGVTSFSEFVVNIVSVTFSG